MWISPRAQSGLGVAMTAFAGLVQDYVELKGWLPKDLGAGRMIAIVGDAELDEGNIHEALIESWKQDIRNCWWIIDYNRQSLDAVVSDRLFMGIESQFKAVGWRVVTLKYGKKLEAAFARADGEALRRWIDDCPNSLYSALVFKGGRGWREHLTRDLGELPGIRRLLDEHDDDALAALMTNLAGHDLEALLEAFHGIADDHRTCFVVYTIKGFGLPFAGHKDNHAGLMNPDQMAEFRRQHHIGDGAEWDKYEGLTLTPRALDEFLAAVSVRGQRHAAMHFADGRAARAIAAGDHAAHVDAGGFRPRAGGSGADRRAAGGADRHDVARCGGVDQSRRLGQPARRVQSPPPRGCLQRTEGGVRAALADDAGRPAYRAGHRREQPVHPAGGARPLALAVRGAAAAHRHGVRSLHSARA